MRRGSMLLSCVMVVAACSADVDEVPPGSDGSPDAGSSSGASSSGAAVQPISPEEYLQGLAAAACAGVESCCRNAELPFVDGACEASTSVDTSAYANALANPAVTYDGVAAAQCLSLAFRIRYVCDMPSDSLMVDSPYGAEDIALLTTDPCGRALSGTKKIDEECTFGECAPFDNPDGYAQVSCRPREDGVAVCHAQRFQTREGAPCNQDPVADEGICMGPLDHVGARPQTQAELDALSLDSLVCHQSRCVPLRTFVRQLGETCTPDQSCFGDSSCRNGVCVARASEGERCEALQCKRGLFCENQVCRPLRADGEACSSGSECHAECNDAGRCSKRTFGVDARQCSGTAQ